VVSSVGTIAVTVAEPVLRLTISNAPQRNALTPQMLDDLSNAVAMAADHEAIRVIVVRGEGDVFSSGYALTSFPQPHELEEDDELTRAAAKLEATPVPSIAVINGDAVGAALHLALSCDFRIAASHARLGITPARFGIIYPWQGIRRAIEVVGLATTKRLFFTAQLFDTREALRLGILDEASDSETSLDDLEETWATRLAGVAPLSVAGTKTILDVLAARRNPSVAERRHILQLRRDALGSRDAQEARSAFRERRPPSFTGS
jgi:enoyl-CoA hydratase/carnithine racemase